MFDLKSRKLNNLFFSDAEEGREERKFPAVSDSK